MTQVPIQHAARLEAMERRARAIAEAGGLDAALGCGALANPVDTTLAEGLVLGLLKQGVRKYLAVFGHGSTDLAEVLRVYEAAGLTRTFNFRHETAMAHAATALKWLYGETAALVVASGLIEIAPNRRAKVFLSTQVVDEGRHLPAAGAMAQKNT